MCQANNKPNGTPCTSDGKPCTADVCSGGVCTHPNLPAGTACGSSSDTDCDNPDTCNGTGSCQSNNEPNGRSCTGDGNSCTSDSCRSGVCAHAPTCDTAQITPTGTTCSQFKTGTAANFSLVEYNVISGKINSAAPGVFFYYTRVTAPSSSFTITIGESHAPIPSPDWKPLGVKQVMVYNASCVTNAVTVTSTTNSGGGVTISVSHATAGAIYYISVKYTPTDLVGISVYKPSGGSYPSVTYTDRTSINTVVVPTSADSVLVRAKP